MSHLGRSSNQTTRGCINLLAAPLGNQNAKNGKLWENALKRAIARRAKGDLEHGLDTLADKVIEAVAGGEQWAALEVGNRLDGKPAQSIQHSGADEGPIQHAVQVAYVGTDPAPR